MKRKWIVAAALGLLSSPAGADEWVYNVEVTQLAVYQLDAGHFVWFSVLPQGCIAANPNNPVMTFRSDRPGGKGLLATLTTALVSKRLVDVQASGCDVLQIYLK